MSSAGVGGPPASLAGAGGRGLWEGGLVILLGVWSSRGGGGRAPRARSWLWRLAYLKLFLALVVLASVEIPLLPAPEMPRGAVPAPPASAAPRVNPAAMPGAPDQPASTVKSIVDADGTPSAALPR